MGGTWPRKENRGVGGRWDIPVTTRELPGSALGLAKLWVDFGLHPCVLQAYFVKQDDPDDEPKVIWVIHESSPNVRLLEKAAGIKHRGERGGPDAWSKSPRSVRRISSKDSDVSSRRSSVASEADTLPRRRLIAEKSSASSPSCSSRDLTAAVT